MKLEPTFKSRVRLASIVSLVNLVVWISVPISGVIVMMSKRSHSSPGNLFWGGFVFGLLCGPGILAGLLGLLFVAMGHRADTRGDLEVAQQHARNALLIGLILGGAQLAWYFVFSHMLKGFNH